MNAVEFVFDEILGISVELMSGWSHPLTTRPFIAIIDDSPEPSGYSNVESIVHNVNGIALPVAYEYIRH